jgi:hypothetical protein
VAEYESCAHVTKSRDSSIDSVPLTTDV